MEPEPFQELPREADVSTKKQRLNFHCTVCDSYFGSNKSLLRHQRENEKHRQRLSLPPAANFVCHCERPFARGDDLRRHQHEVHEGQHRVSASQKAAIRNAQASSSMQQESLTLAVTNEARLLHPEKETEGMERATISHSARAETWASEVLSMTPKDHEALEETIRSGFEQLRLSDSKETKLLHGASKGKLPSRLRRCPICLQYFNSSLGLLQCMTAHGTDAFRIHQCKDCQLGFFRLEHLQKHIDTANRETDPHCGFNFPHVCSGHHPKADAQTHSQMNRWYIKQLYIRAVQRADSLESTTSACSRQTRWSIGVVKERFFHRSNSTLNSYWTMPIFTELKNSASMPKDQANFDIPVWNNIRLNNSTVKLLAFSEQTLHIAPFQMVYTLLMKLCPQKLIALLLEHGVDISEFLERNNGAVRSLGCKDGRNTGEAGRRLRVKEIVAFIINKKLQYL